ncbi:MAG: hypothetical protein A2513_07935 [Sulfurimonas sp. RIFOXYD12_FULL_33_39]|uniref:hypothetical protein n=1 Tax=unclassified Sulfurimonas TaxID=2623549 RepID=UPI0008C1ED80|nr:MULTISPECIES: hypothetical protein [unclassified Sulfurimonas]OHE07819.1 MAG: hypothetical protein A3G74_02150 [Sulfurimonas sp. RIFCSPLOWO2_12_FULL_34_6]OHE10021.1 MAG: hypothetical protein A2513_07935 [Sulfurimonas sp. RIFOXYD12_FULL_33_39]OHE14759.1 MAG: hypothetical protein A2530_02545 [Sulfurimonas sp. RIFOXYD2_FULL_34_21]
MVRVRFLLVFLFVVFSFFGCQEQSANEVGKINWDRDMCDRCVMVISDRKNTVQLRDLSTNKLYKFDDIGCMAIWFNEENIEFKDKAKIWITDVESGEWIDARAAFYTSQNITPMGFGFSAHKTKNSIKNNSEILSYDEVLKRIK